MTSLSITSPHPRHRNTFLPPNLASTHPQLLHVLLVQASETKTTFLPSSSALKVSLCRNLEWLHVSIWRTVLLPILRPLRRDIAPPLNSGMMTTSKVRRNHSAAFLWHSSTRLRMRCLKRACARRWEFLLRAGTSLLLVREMRLSKDKQRRTMRRMSLWPMEPWPWVGEYLYSSQVVNMRN